MDEDEAPAAPGEVDDIAGWEVLSTLGTEQEAMLLVGFLRANGLPAYLAAQPTFSK